MTDILRMFYTPQEPQMSPEEEAMIQQQQAAVMQQEQAPTVAQALGGM